MDITSESFCFTISTHEVSPLIDGTSIDPNSYCNCFMSETMTMTMTMTKRFGGRRTMTRTTTQPLGVSVHRCEKGGWIFVLIVMVTLPALSLDSITRLMIVSKRSTESVGGEERVICGLLLRGSLAHIGSVEVSLCFVECSVVVKTHLDFDLNWCTQQTNGGAKYCLVVSLALSGAYQGTNFSGTDDA